VSARRRSARRSGGRTHSRASARSSCSLQLAGRHDVVAVEIRDPREQELPNAGELWLVDPETGRQLRVDTRSAKLRRRFAEAASAERGYVARTFASVGVRHVVLSTSGDWLRELALFLRRAK
jgi:uncharacterized protein (DUF58 family)